LSEHLLGVKIALYRDNHHSLMPNRPTTVFIVDDDPDDRQIILDACLENNAPIDYVFVENGSELLEVLNRPGIIFPSLILLDLNMPGLPGIQVLKRIKENTKTAHIPVIIFTTSVLPSDKSHAYDEGANCFITKPESFTELMQITHSILLLWFRDLMVNKNVEEETSTIK
jgi:CheY-like chemotaxis protein